MASKARWDVIAQTAKARCDEGLTPIIVCSAVTQVSNALETLSTDFAAIKKIHFDLANELCIDASELLGADLRELEQLLVARSSAGAQSPKLQAQIMAYGELLSTRLGFAYLAQNGLKVAWQDAREVMLAKSENHANAQRQYLAAACDFDEDPELQDRFLSLKADVIITQGFIAHNQALETVLLGRGGSDTSAAYFAAKLKATRCEIWTDVPGLYTADPRIIRSARILYQLDYDEAQEMATMGAKVLHPRCIAPVKHARIPLHIRSTNEPGARGTVICDAISESTRVKSISTKSKVSLISIESLGMWQEVGFLADFFGVFKKHGLSIDLVSTSETNVTVSIDSLANAVASSTLDALAEDLCQFGKVKRIEPCATVSLVGRNIRSILHQLGPALKVFEEHKVFLVSQAASDLNLSFVVQEDKAQRLALELHQLLFDTAASDPSFGPAWQSAQTRPMWWQQKSAALLELAFKESPLYVYDAETLKNTAASVQSLSSIDQVFYAMKANDNDDVLKIFYDLGLGFECVSLAELDYLFSLFKNIDPARVLFTPNFAPRHEYAAALKSEVNITVDNLYALEKWPELFAQKKLFLRLDPGRGFGHHQHVQTAGEQSKFGISRHEIDKAVALSSQCGATVIGLHAHAGSGIKKPSHWVDMAQFLVDVAKNFPDVKTLNLGGGLHVPSLPHEDALDLAQFDAALLELRKTAPQFRLWLEPGRYLVANAGVLLAKVTQLKEKGDTKFVGIDAGMNSLIRPALYGAYHHIVNLTRLNDAAEMTAHVVGPICESGDTLGHDRKLPKTSEGDILLIATTGAYGRVMSSRYNRREPASEYLLC